MKISEFDYKNINNDINGNPRIVIHFLTFADDYTTAKNIAKSLGGKPYRGADFGGGFVFQAHLLPRIQKRLEETKKDFLNK